mmetsp:Transcript_15845/g.50491  ORF Transcript_15845/g.50491 Transcript_15845/m.50491 type:complete len:240 (-) Transcript_15845:219-938(-)
MTFRLRRPTTPPLSPRAARTAARTRSLRRPSPSPRCRVTSPRSRRHPRWASQGTNVGTATVVIVATGIAGTAIGIVSAATGIVTAKPACRPVRACRKVAPHVPPRRLRAQPAPSAPPPVRPRTASARQRARTCRSPTRSPCAGKSSTLALQAAVPQASCARCRSARATSVVPTMVALPAANVLKFRGKRTHRRSVSNAHRRVRSTRRPRKPSLSSSSRTPCETSACASSALTQLPLRTI